MAERGASLAERLRLDDFFFWKNVGGPLPGRPAARLRMAGIWHLLGYIRYAWWGAAGLLVSIFAAAYVGVLPPS